MPLRNIPVRKRLHELDRTKSSYPSVARTGDVNRRGKYSLVYDDTNTVIFKSSAMVSFPTTLESGSKYLSSDIASTITNGTTFFISGSVSKTAVDPWLVRGYEAEPFQGFKEDNLFEQVTNSSSNQYYQTGSAVADVGLGFQSSLLSKTIIRIDLPITGITTLNPLTASTYYYDFDTKKFERAWIHTPNYATNFGTVDSSLGPGESAIPPLASENLLFNFLGKHSSFLRSTGDYIATPPDTLPDFFFEAKNGDPVNSVDTTASGSQLLNLEGVINQPFLLEKCVFRIPFMAGPGWFKDMTHMVWTNWSDFDPYWGIDFAGPALTVGLFNQFQNNQKDLILSGTIIPQRDNSREYRRVNSFFQRTAGELTPFTQSFFPQGFRSFSLPTTIIPGSSTTFFTGSISLETTPQVSVGITAMERREPITPTVRKPIPFVQSLVGRAKVGTGIQNLLGRSIFGRATNVPKFSDLYQINQDLCALSGINDERFFQIEKHTNAPYLLFPKDKLFLSISKWRSAFVSESFGTVADPTYIAAGLGQPYASNPDGTSVMLYQSASHDVQINSGTLSIILYGSLIREGKEIYSTLNSRLDTEEVHEMIGSEPIVDEFDVHYLDELTGSYLDRFLTGSFFSSGQDARQRIFSNIKPSENNRRLLNGELGLPFDVTSFSTALVSRNEVALNPRFTQNLSQDERFWDSLPPDIPSYVETGGGSITFSSTFSGVNEILIGQQRDIVARGFPFEPKLSNILRSKNERIKFILANGSATSRDVNRSFTVYLSDQLYFIDIMNSTQRGLSKEDLFKVLYGFGRNNRCVTTGSGNYGTTQFVGIKYVSSSLNVVGPSIRGWKYGLASALPLFTKAIFRRDRHGQFRDMLEQRADTKIYLESQSQVTEGPVRIKFVNSNNETVIPEETLSSNLSFEATSSIPYDDGKVRNREEPISFANINQSIVVI